MLKTEHKQLSLHSILYNRIPENHILKSINNAVDFSFVNDLLESSYCKYYGRPAKEPEMMTRLIILQYLYNLSDVKVIKDPKFIEQKGIRSLVDQDARVGRKTQIDMF